MCRIMTVRAPRVCGFSSILTPAALPPPPPSPYPSLRTHAPSQPLHPSQLPATRCNPHCTLCSPPPPSLPPQVIGAKLERLLAAAPAATLDCSQLFDAQRLLSAIAHAATKHAGTASCAAAAQAAAALSHATPAAAAATVHTIYMSGNCLQPQHMPELVEQLRKFPALKRLDVSANPALRLLPVGLLRIAADLEAFNCDGCSLLLPPQSFFSTPDENPRRVQQLLQSGSLNLSGLQLTPAAACEAAALLVHYPVLKQLDVSANPALGGGGAAALLSSLAGMHVGARA